jgi:muconolactone delta-isomerase
MKFLVFTKPIDGIMHKLPRAEDFELQIEWVRDQLNSGRFDLAYHGENHAVAIVNAESSEALDQLYDGMPLIELTTRHVEPLSDLVEQMQGVAEALRKFHSQRKQTSSTSN